MKLTEKQIEEIAENLDCGMRCFYNLKTGEIKILPEFDNLIVADEELWNEDIEEIEENRADYFEFEGLESRDSFKIMDDFAKSVDNAELRDKLVRVLNDPKPFKNFKWNIDNSGDYRQHWFDFKKNRYIQWVKKQIELRFF